MPFLGLQNSAEVLGSHGTCLTTYYAYKTLSIQTIALESCTNKQRRFSLFFGARLSLQCLRGGFRYGGAIDLSGAKQQLEGLTEHCSTVGRYCSIVGTPRCNKPLVCVYAWHLLHSILGCKHEAREAQYTCPSSRLCWNLPFIAPGESFVQNAKKKWVQLILIVNMPVYWARIVLAANKQL